ncbi:MAG TPA: outer membrane protein transport protein [Magnetospirillum sp.]|nr:outer membrane protein transport protein [Magnetospirillum sp.]
MPRRDIRLAAIAVAAMAALPLGPDAADASGFQLREQSADGMGNAMAGSTAKAYDLSTLFYNPAGMARLNGSQAGLGAAWVAPYSRFEGTNTVGGVAVAGSDGGNHPQPVAVGSAYAMWDAAPDWRLGLAVTSPFGMRSSYDDGWVGRYHALDTTLTTVNASPSVSYRVDDALSVAVGLQIGYLDAQQTNAINFGALVPGAGDGLFRVSGTDLALGWTTSLLYQFTPSTRMGLSYRSSIRHAIHGKAEFRSVPGALAGNAAFADSGVDVVVPLPDTLSLGLYHEISPQWAVMSDVAWTRWSAFRTLRLQFDSGRPDAVEPENWHDTGFLSVGVTYRPSDQLGLHLGTAFDRAAVGDRFRNARLPDSNRYWLSSGLSYAPSPTHQFSLSYTHVFADTAAIDRTDPDQIGGRLSGRYDNHVDIVSANYTVRF